MYVRAGMKHVRYIIHYLLLMNEELSNNKPAKKVRTSAVPRALVIFRLPPFGERQQQWARKKFWRTGCNIWSLDYVADRYVVAPQGMHRSSHGQLNLCIPPPGRPSNQLLTSQRLWLYRTLFKSRCELLCNC